MKGFVLEADHSIIAGKPFIITSWSPLVDKVGEQILSISVYAHFSRITFVLQPMVGLNWLASVVGKLKCFDANTIARNR